MFKKTLSTTILEAPAKILSFEEVAASQNKPMENLDTMFLGFNLCHEGVNTNGDRLIIDEMKRSWKTAAYKPIDWDHEEPNVGVIVDSSIRVEGDEVSKASREPAVIYCVGNIWKARYPEYAELIAQAAEDGSLKMSMEAYFSDCDYVIGDYDEVIPMAEASDEIEELRGTFYNGKLVSRALKNVIFGGAGVTATPADKKARIWACASNKSDKEYHEYLHDAYEGRKLSVMSKDLIIAEHQKVHWKMAKDLGK